MNNPFRRQPAYPARQTRPFPAGALAVAAIVSALGFGLGFANDFLTCPPLVLLCPAALALLSLKAAGDRQAFLLGFLAALPGHIWALYWLVLPLAQVGGLPAAGATACMLLVCTALATQGGLFTLAARRLWAPASPACGLALGLLWYFLEYAYAAVAGFPWLQVSGALALWPVLVQAADTTGSLLLGGLWVAAAILVAGAFLGAKGMRRRIRPACAGLVVAAALTGYGVFALEREPAEAMPDGADSFPVIFAEGNIDQNQKWDKSFRQGTVAAYLRLTEQGLAAAKARWPEGDLARGIIIWPETAMPFDLARSPLAADIMRMARTARMPLLTGAIGQEPGRRVYNRIYLMDETGYPAGIYDKEHLVPFGEYVPSFFQWGFLEGLLQEVGAYTPGTRTQPLRAGHLALGPLICYEGIFPWLAQERVRTGANVLVDVSNDGWFGDTPAPRQHLALTALRAVEQNRWIVRGTNTGISCVMDARGRVVLRGTQFREGTLLARARTLSQASPFHTAYPFIPPAAAIVLVLIGWRQYRIRHHHASAD